MTPLRKLGLPVGELGVTALLYNSAAQALVAVLDSMRGGGSEGERRIFVRHVSDATYREIRLPNAQSFVTQVVSCDLAPTLFVNAFGWVDRYGQATGPEGSGANHRGIFRVSLPDGAVTRVELKSTEKMGGFWVSRLIGATPDGACLRIVGCASADDRGESCPLGYGLFELTLDTGGMRHIVDLPGIFA